MARRDPQHAPAQSLELVSPRALGVEPPPVVVVAETVGLDRHSFIGIREIDPSDEPFTVSDDLLEHRDR